MRQLVLYLNSFKTKAKNKNKNKILVTNFNI